MSKTKDALIEQMNEVADSVPHIDYMKRVEIATTAINLLESLGWQVNPVNMILALNKLGYIKYDA